MLDIADAAVNEGNLMLMLGGMGDTLASMRALAAEAEVLVQLVRKEAGLQAKRGLQEEMASLVAAALGHLAVVGAGAGAAGGLVGELEQWQLGPQLAAEQVDGIHKEAIMVLATVQKMEQQVWVDVDNRAAVDQMALDIIDGILEDGVAVAEIVYDAADMAVDMGMSPATCYQYKV